MVTYGLESSVGALFLSLLPGNLTSGSDSTHDFEGGGDSTKPPAGGGKPKNEGVPGPGGDRRGSRGDGKPPPTSRHHPPEAYDRPYFASYGVFNHFLSRHWRELTDSATNAPQFSLLDMEHPSFLSGLYRLTPDSIEWFIDRRFLVIHPFDASERKQYAYLFKSQKWFRLVDP
jgi:hypothetical protein